MEWRNWAGNIRFTPNEIARPQTTEDVVELVRTGRKIRCVGTGHSWSALAPTSDILMTTDDLNRIISIDRANNRATIQAGAKLEHLNESLWAEGFAFANLGSIARQSLAGAISTGTHGTGKHFKVLSEMVVSFRLVTADGEILDVDRKKDPALFNTAIISLGALGIITEITISIVPRFNLHERSGLMDFEVVCDNILNWVKEESHIKLWWFAHTDKMMVYRYNPTYEPINDSWFRQKLMDEWISVYMYRIMLWWSNRKPIRRKWMNRKIVEGLLPNVNRIERSYKVFNVPEPPVHRETEWAFDINLTPTLLREYKQMVEENGHLINFIQEIRFVKADEFALSPCHGRDSVYVGAYNADNRGWEELLADFESLAKRHNGRPHWGKEFTVGTDYLKSVYPKWVEFKNLKERLDPQDKFSNRLTDSLFNE